MTQPLSRVRTVRGWIHYIWLRVGLTALVVMPIAAYLMFRAQGLPTDTWTASATIAIDDRDEYFQFGGPAILSAERVVFLPGCPVEPEAYAPLARELALHGVTTLVVRVPRRCAPFAGDAATLRMRVQAALATCADCTWTVAGHSRGARHALELLSAMPTRFQRLVLIGSTHPRDRDYSRLTIPVLKIGATNDGVAPQSASAANRHLLPASTQWVEIEGGNHAQFGYYGYQLFDRRATIGRQEQHAMTARAVASFIRDKK